MRRELERAVLAADAIDRELERAGEVGVLGLGALLWRALPAEERERMVTPRCDACRELVSRCACCDACGYVPCACEDRFAIDCEGT